MTEILSALVKRDTEPINKPQTSSSIRLYKRRWVIIFIFAFYLATNFYQWLSLVVIGDVVRTFYNESLPDEKFRADMAIDWLSLIYMLAYTVLIIPSMWLLQRKGVRFCAVCGTLINALGAWIKVAAVSPDRFAVLFFAQTVCAISQTFTLGLPTRIAAVWFAQNEVSTATGIAVFGIQIGSAVGFLTPPMLVPFSFSVSDTSPNLYTMFYVIAGVTTLAAVLTIIVFREKPPYQPSVAEMAKSTIRDRKVNYKQSLKNLLTNRDFCLLCFSFASITGSSYAISTLLNPIILFYFEDSQKDVGAIGLTMILSGVVGSLISGFWLDRTKTFKATTVGIYVLSLVGMVIYTFILELEKIWIVYLCVGFFGFFMTGFLPVGFQFAAEVTYPESEGLSSGLLNCSAEIIGIVCTIGMRALMTNFGIFAANITVCSALLLGTFLTVFTRPKYKRQRAGKEMKREVELEDSTPLSKQPTDDVQA